MTRISRAMCLNRSSSPGLISVPVGRDQADALRRQVFVQIEDEVVAGAKPACLHPNASVDRLALWIDLQIQPVVQDVVARLARGNWAPGGAWAQFREAMILTSAEGREGEEEGGQEGDRSSHGIELGMRARQPSRVPASPGGMLPAVTSLEPHFSHRTMRALLLSLLGLAASCSSPGTTESALPMVADDLAAETSVKPRYQRELAQR